MSVYTTQLRFICESLAGRQDSTGYSNVNEIVQIAAPKIFNFEFPIFDENYRSVIETKILKHYYTREISEESFGLWQLRLDTKINEIFPYYNKLYETEKLKFNPLYNTELVKGYYKGTDGNQKLHEFVQDDSIQKRQNQKNANGQESITREKTNWDLFQDTPQNSLNGVNNLEFLTEARKITDEDHDTNNKKESHTITDNNTNNQIVNRNNTLSLDSTENYVEKICGKQAGESFSKLIVEYRNSLINIDLMVIDELKDLFFNLYGGW